ncbi:MAG TPA: glycoside hydrolase family 15 protein [Phycisphaerales bacterium]|nr:glycoside hydrolase family 15 protein [Phycisphaerales bacterium]
MRRAPFGLIRPLIGALAAALCVPAVLAQPAFVFHDPASPVHGEPAGTSMREPEVAREDEEHDWWIKTGPSFSYDFVVVYYTADGSEPNGSFGSALSPATLVLRSYGPSPAVSFVRNEPGQSGNDDWWRADFAGAFQYRVGTTIRYKIGVWKNGVGAEAQTQTFQYALKLAWPGAGAGQPNPQAGYPPVAFWKEEAFIGNTFTAAMLDQNGAWYDMQFPTPGGVQVVGTKNEGYSDGPDTFPAMLSPEKRGQMHLNQAQVGIRVGGLTHWLANPNGVSYTGVTQSYLTDETNTVRTAQTLTAGGNNIGVTQTDFAPAGIDFPDGFAGTGEQKHILVKRVVLRNNGASQADVNVYLYMDPAINGGDDYDAMFWDASRGAMTVFDKTRRTVTGTGAFITPPNEYNITTFGGYEKNIALYLSGAMKVAGGPQAGPATDAWRDSSGDNGQGWIGKRVTLPPGVDVEIDFMLAGAHYRPEPVTDPMPAFDGVYDNELAPTIDWFNAADMAGVQAQTDAHWSGWLADGTTIDTPDDGFDRLMKRSLLATALHQDGVHGGIVAGYHNGAYLYVWPRDAMWAAVTLARTGHTPEARKAIDWMRVHSYRDFEPWGRKGFWKQKCTTDGFTVWGAPQIDGTAVFPWALKMYDDMSGDSAYLSTNLDAVRDAVLSMTSDSSDSRLRWEEAFNLSYSNNLWEDSYDTFLFSNANIHRGLQDAATIFTRLGLGSEASDAATRAGWVKSGLDGRLDWDGENTDISQLGIVYPFEVYSPIDFRSARVIDRINGVRRKFNNTHPNPEPLVNFAGYPNDQYGWTGLINRYWGDGYWGGGTPHGAGPWFLTTMWYGCYYAARQDFTPGTSDIDNHKFRLELLMDQLGPVGLGAEQIAPRSAGGGLTGSLLYPGQNDFTLQTAWPNAWESMSFFVDSLMMFLEYKPDARANTMRFEPKLPGTWQTMTFNNVEMQSGAPAPTHRVDVTIARDASGEVHTFVNRLGNALDVETILRADPNVPIASVTRNGVPVPYTLDPATGRVTVGTLPLETGANAITVIRVNTGLACDSIDFNGDQLFPDNQDLEDFLSVFGGGPCSTGMCADIDFNNDQLFPDNQDLEAFFSVFGGGPCL